MPAPEKRLCKVGRPKVLLEKILKEDQLYFGSSFGSITAKFGARLDRMSMLKVQLNARLAPLLQCCDVIECWFPFQSECSSSKASNSDENANTPAILHKVAYLDQSPEITKHLEQSSLQD